MGPRGRSGHLILVALPGLAREHPIAQVIWGGQVRAAKMNAESARQRAKEAACEADRAEAYAWSLRMEGFGGPAQRNPPVRAAFRAATLPAIVC